MPKKNRPAKAKDTTAAPLGTERVKLLLSRNKIQKRIREMAKAIRSDFPTEPLLLLGVLKGAVLFLADLSRQIPGEVTFDFIAVSSYGQHRRQDGNRCGRYSGYRFDPALSPAHFAATQAQKSTGGRSIGQSGPPSDRCSSRLCRLCNPKRICSRLRT